ncbi:MAG: response regulator [Anaerolinea sp.]|nr:response regulator [Anaerolinea sp.]MCC6976263.1 response regulator [Anaerolineae bacterium]CAG0955208.1 Polar-differentiation response regulator DivK [Anaerolineae bacterium]
MSEKTALIIDDNQANLEVLRLLLTKNGVRAVTLDSPRQISATLDELGTVNVIFLDLEFPNYDGFELLPKMKQDPRLKNIPIVAYSVHTSEISRARTAGFHSFLGKPIQPELFAQQLQAILNGQSVWSS